MSKKSNIVIIAYDSDHSDFDWFVDCIVRKAVKLQNPKIYRYYPTDEWWDDRQYFFILGAKNKNQAFKKIAEESEQQGFALDKKNLYGE